MTLATTHPKSITKLAEAVQPLVFETGLHDFPYSTAGTLFLASWEGAWYVVTTRHALRPENPTPLCVFPNDRSRQVFTLGNVFFVSFANESEDYVDLAVIDIDTVSMKDTELLTALPLDLSKIYFEDWETRVNTHTFYLLGYPNELSNVEYKNQFLRTDRIVLRGATIDRSPIDHLYMLNVENSCGLASFSGLSGGPIFAASELDENTEVIFCGMAIRGTPTSKVVHFVPSQVIVHAIKVKRSLDHPNPK